MVVTERGAPSLEGLEEQLLSTDEVALHIQSRAQLVKCGHRARVPVSQLASSCRQHAAIEALGVVILALLAHGLGRGFCFILYTR